MHHLACMWVIQLFPPSQKKNKNKNWCETNLISYQAAKVQTLHNVTNIINKYWGFIIFIKHKFAWIGLFNMSVYKNQKFIAVKMGGNRFYWKPQIYHVYIYTWKLPILQFSTKNRCPKEFWWNHRCSSWKLLLNHFLKTKYIQIRSSPHYTLKHRQILYPCTHNCLQLIDLIFHANVIQTITLYAHKHCLIHCISK